MKNNQHLTLSYMCVWVCVYIYMYVCIYIYVYTYITPSTYLKKDQHLIFSYVYVYIYIYIYIYICKIYFPSLSTKTVISLCSFPGINFRGKPWQLLNYSFLLRIYKACIQGSFITSLCSQVEGKH